MSNPIDNPSAANTSRQQNSTPGMMRGFLYPLALAACLCALVGGLLLTGGPASAQSEPSFGSAAIEDMAFLTYDAGISIALPEATGGTAPLTYSLSGAPTGMSFDADTRTLSGSPTATQEATAYTYTVTDSASTPATATLSFTVTVGDGPASDRAVLEVLYDATDGDNWGLEDSNWKKDSMPLDSWHGITTDSNGRVTKLLINDKFPNVNGNVPADLGKLSNLIWLNLGGTCRQAKDERGQRFCTSGGFTGPIPPELGNLTQLYSLTLWNNTLTGPIPPELANLHNAARIRIDKNLVLDESTGEFTGGLSGSIPAELGNLSKISILNFSDNGLTGAIPPELANLPTLQRINFSNNKLTGTIPPELSNLPELNTLILDKNQLSGAIPVELGNLPELQWLSLSYNQLSGAIPVELGNLSKLKRLKLNRNQLSGAIPAELGNLAEVRSMWLNNNQLSGPIPPVLGSLPKLADIIVNDNQLSGSIPAELGNLKLLYLWLQNNQLSGKLPASLTSLTSLKQFYAGNSGACLPESDSALQTWFQSHEDLADPRATLRGCRPLAPELSLSRESKQVTASWTPQRESLPVLDYTLQWKSRDEEYADTRSMVVTDSSETVTGLVDGMSYEFRVRARNSEGDGAWMEVAAPLSPLTASFSNVPEREDATSPFSFQLSFSEYLDRSLSSKTLRDQAVTATNGDVTHVRRVVKRENQHWTVTVQPHSAGDVTVSLAGSGDCETAPVICTADGRALSNTPSVIVAGTPLTASFNNVPERQDATSPFSFELSFSEVFGGRLTYKMLRDQALLATNGKVTNARRVTPGWDHLWNITVQPRSGGDVTVSLAGSGNCETAPAICTPDGRALSNTPSVTVAGPPLTASFSNLPERQDTRSPFSFQMSFSENFGGRLRYKMLRDEALQATNGKVTHARRVTPGQNQHWTITVQPHSGGDVTVSLAASGDCETAPAICTPDGRALSNTPSVTVAGPPLTASFNNVPERQDTTSPFSFQLSFSENFGGRLRYKMLRDEALQTTNGKVTNARRVTSGQNQHWTITVQPHSGGDVTVSLITSGDCETAPAICTPDGRALSNAPSVTVAGPP